MAFIILPTVSVIILLSQISPITSEDVSPVCSVNATTLSAVPGEVDYLMSPNYPSPYYNNADCRWLIDAGSGYAVKVSVLNVSLETCCDFLYLYDGTQLYDTFIMIKFSSTPSQTDFYSSGQYMYIRFYSDISITYSGFSLTYEASDQQSVFTSVCSDNTTALLAVVGEVNYLASPDYPYNYLNNASCQWLITAPTGYIVRVTLLEVSLDECCDYLNLVDGMSDSDPSLGRFYVLPSQRLINSSGQYMYINFSTNGIPRRGGFNLYYEAVLLSDCPVDGKNVSVVPGQIHYLTSPNYPLNYHNDADCRWLMYAPSGYVVMVTVWTVNLDLHYDYLQILDGVSDDSTSIATFRSTPSQKVYSSCGQYMLIRFFTNFFNVSLGFNLTYESVPTYMCSVYPKDLTAVVAEAKYLSSSNSSHYYCNVDSNAICRWLISAPTGYVVRVTLEIVSIEECCDYVSLVDASQPHDITFSPLADNKVKVTLNISMSDSDPSIGRFNVTPSQPVYNSSGQYMYIDFYTNAIGENRVFSLYYEAVLLSECPEDGKNLSAVPGEIHFLTSPNYPLNYYNNADCRWLIYAPSGYVVKVTVVTYILASDDDYLEIFNGISSSYLGLYTPSLTVYNSCGQYMYIRFVTDHSGVDSGFSLIYEAVSLESSSTNCSTLTTTSLSDPQITSTTVSTPATTTSVSAAEQQRVINVKVVYRKRCTRN